VLQKILTAVAVLNDEARSADSSSFRSALRGCRLCAVSAKVVVEMAIASAAQLAATGSAAVSVPACVSGCSISARQLVLPCQLFTAISVFNKSATVRMLKTADTADLSTLTLFLLQW